MVASAPPPKNKVRLLHKSEAEQRAAGGLVAVVVGGVVIHACQSDDFPAASRLLQLSCFPSLSSSAPLNARDVEQLSSSSFFASSNLLVGREQQQGRRPPAAAVENNRILPRSNKHPDQTTK